MKKASAASEWGTFWLAKKGLIPCHMIDQLYVSSNQIVTLNDPQMDLFFDIDEEFMIWLRV